MNIKNSILFLAPYPTPENIKDGMISRISAIDQFFTSSNRVYLDATLFKNWKKTYQRINGVDIYQLNTFVHIILIARLVLFSRKIYSHSIWGCLGIFFFLPFLHKCIVLDAHGVVPEEIKYYSRKKWAVIILNLLEYLVIRKTIAIICVTNRMQSHFEEKYPWYRGRYFVYSIMPQTICGQIDEEKIKEAKSSDKIIIIYSGGISPWQNIDLMLESIKEGNNPDAKYILLVSNPSYLKSKIIEHNIKSDVEILSVQPKELSKYYEMADYAFILRDDNIVNRVANPTKMVEYLANGIIPIVLSNEIGDYASRGYEYVKLDDFKNGLTKPASFSHKNISIAKSLIKENSAVDILNMLLNIW